MACRVSAHPRVPGAPWHPHFGFVCSHHAESPYAEAQGLWVLLDAVQFGIQSVFIECLKHFAAFGYCEQLDAHFACEGY